MAIRKVYLELTSKCNLNCSMCYRKSWTEPAKDMEKSVLDKCVNEIKENSTIQEVVLGGIGEPMYSPNVLDTIYQLRDKKLIITTNGTIMDEEVVKAMVDCVDEVVVSIDGLDDEYYAVRGYPLEKLVENIKLLNLQKKAKQKSTPMLFVQMVISKNNMHQVMDVIDLSKGICANKVIISNILPASKSDEEIITYTRYENDEIKKLFYDISAHIFRRGIDVMLPAYQLKTERRCRFIDNDALMINVDGDVVPCYRFAHDCSESVFGRIKQVHAHSFGKIKDSTFQEIWDSEEYSYFRSTVYNNHYPSCIDCDWADGCDLVSDAKADCYSNVPSCGDCLWARKIVYCI